MLRPTFGVLDELGRTPSITRCLRIGDHLGDVAAQCPNPAVVGRLLDRTIATARATSDGITAISAIHAIGRVADDHADATLVRLLLEADPSLVGHVAWVLGGRAPDLAAVDALIDLIVAGGFDAMLAQRTLVRWSAWADRPIAEQLRRRIPSVDPAAAQRLLDTIEAPPPLGRGPVPAPTPGRVTVIQPFLHARLDAAGSRLGAGDAGGIASLIWSLGTALAHGDSIAEVVTVTRAHSLERADDADAPGFEPADERLGPGHRVARIRYGGSAAIPLGDAWVHRLTIERELTRLGRSITGPVVWHLRMADVGTLAAAAVARRCGHRVVFTVAPDPHAVIASDQRAGRIDRKSFAAADAGGHLWFRARMVERLAAAADRVVALPRPGLRDDLRELLGIEVDDPAHPVTVVPEGVDTDVLDRAEARLRRTTRPADVVAGVRTELPPARRDKPWLLTVGRLHPVKGVHRLVESWAGCAELQQRFNVVVVGGDLRDPSPTEQLALDLIAGATSGLATPGLVMLGHRPPELVADLLTHAASHGGMYVGAGDKEEFGLAIVSALGAGLVVVAPESGGASTYIDQGTTGFVTDTGSIPALRRAITDAARLTPDAERRAHARAFVRAELSVRTMAERLEEVYQDVWSGSISIDRPVAASR